MVKFTYRYGYLLFHVRQGLGHICQRLIANVLVVYLRECVLIVRQIALVHKVQMLYTRAANQVLQTTDAHLHAVAVALLEHGQQIEHLLELRIAHVLLPDEEADGGPAGQPPVLAHELQLRLDIVNQKGHVPIQIKVRHLENERIAENCHSADAVHLAGAQGTYGSGGTTRKADLVVYAQMLIDFNELRGAPDLHRFHLINGTIINIGKQVITIDSPRAAFGFECRRWPSWPAGAWTLQSGRSAPQDLWQCPVRITQKLLEMM